MSVRSLIHPALLTAAAVALLLGCRGGDDRRAATGAVDSASTAADTRYREPASLPVSFIPGETRPASATPDTLPPAPRVEGQAGGFIATGAIRLPSACTAVRSYRWDLPVDTLRAGTLPTVIVSIIAEPGPQTCEATPVELPYQVAVSGLAPGSYSVQVVHRYDGIDWGSLTFGTPPVSVR